MIKFTNKDGVSTPWLSKIPTEKELKRCSIEQLLIIASKRKGFKNILINFLKEKTL